MTHPTTQPRGTRTTRSGVFLVAIAGWALSGWILPGAPHHAAIARDPVVPPAEPAAAAQAPIPTQAELLTRRLAETYRRLVRRTPPEARTDLLAELLSDPEPELRRLGFELVQLELAEARRPGPPVLEAARVLLSDADPVLRARAASLLNQLADPAVASSVLVALERETDPVAANEMLRAVARWPRPEAVGPVLNWMEREPRVRASATETAWSLERAQVLGQADRERILTALRATPAGEMTLAGVRFLARSNVAADRRLLVELLTGPTPATRVAAGEALAQSPAHVDVLLAAAESDALLAPPAAEAVARHRPDAVTYARLRQIPFENGVDRSAALSRVAGAMWPSEILLTADALERLPAGNGNGNGNDRARDELDALLSALIAPAPDAPHLSDQEQARARRDGLARLAALRLDAARPEPALAALNAIPPTTEPSAGAERIERLRLIALVWSNRIPAATELDAPPSSWLAALERAIREPHAPEIVRTIRERFDSLLTPTERDRLERLAARLPTPTPDRAEIEDEPAPPPGAAEPPIPTDPDNGAQPTRSPAPINPPPPRQGPI